MKGGGVEPAAPWSPDEVARFFDAFHEHGSDFDKVGPVQRRQQDGQEDVRPVQDGRTAVVQAAAA